MQLFSADAAMFLKKLFFLPIKSRKKTPSKVTQNYSFFLPIAAKMAQTEEFMFQNVAYKGQLISKANSSVFIWTKNEARTHESTILEEYISSGQK